MPAAALPDVSYPGGTVSDLIAGVGAVQLSVAPAVAFEAQVHTSPTSWAESVAVPDDDDDDLDLDIDEDNDSPDNEVDLGGDDDLGVETKAKGDDDDADES